MSIFSIDKLPFSQRIQWEFDSASHFSESYFVCFVLNGEIALTLFDTQHILRTNDICFIPPYELYAFAPLRPESCMLVIEISREFIENYCPDHEYRSFRECQLRCNLEDPLYYQIASAIARIVFYTINIKATANLHMVSAAASIMAVLLDHYGCETAKTFSSGNYSRQRVIRTLRYINENYTEKITLKDIAGYVGVHPQYFSSFFRKNFGKSFVEYLNNYRVQKSLLLLTDPEKSITDIALACGFGDHKAFSACFKKVYEMTPSAFRKKMAKNHNYLISPIQSSPIPFNAKSYFQFFQRFWNQSMERGKNGARQTYVSLRTDLRQQKPGQKNFQLKINTLGRAVSCLQSNIQEAIREAKKELKFDYLRIRDIFSDDLYIYYEDGDHNVRYNWNYIDMVLDFFVSLDIKPVMEIGFMPSSLASKKQTCGWQYHPNVSFPKSLNRWCDLVSQFMLHCIRRYGQSQVHTWYFDFWTSPNLSLEEAYWYDSQEDFFRFYKATWQAVKRADPHIIMGSPAFSMPSGLDWYEAFFDYCKENNISPDYVAVHTYCCPDDLQNSSHFPKPKTQSEAFSVPYDKDLPEKTFRQLKELCSRKGYDRLPIISMSWNMSYLPCDYVRDTCFMGPYIIYTLLHSLKDCAGMSYWTLCDTNDELYPDNRMFSGNPGLIDTIGLKKPAYYALALYRRLGDTIIEYDNCHILTRSQEGYQLLLFNFCFYFESWLKEDHTAPSYTERNKYFDASGEIIYHHSISMVSGPCLIRRTQLCETCGSTYNTWLNSGSPQVIDTEMVRYIQYTSIPKITLDTVYVNETLILDTVVPEYGVVLYEITPQIDGEG